MVLLAVVLTAFNVRYFLPPFAMETTGTHKIRLLEKQEIEDIYSLPKLSEQEREILRHVQKKRK